MNTSPTPPDRFTYNEEWGTLDLEYDNLDEVIIKEFLENEWIIFTDEQGIEQEFIMVSVRGVGTINFISKVEHEKMLSGKEVNKIGIPVCAIKWAKDKKSLKKDSM